MNVAARCQRPSEQETGINVRKFIGLAHVFVSRGIRTRLLGVTWEAHWKISADIGRRPPNTRQSASLDRPVLRPTVGIVRWRIGARQFRPFQ